MRERAGAVMVGELLETATTRWLPGLTSENGSLTMMILDEAGGFMVIKLLGIVNVLPCEEAAPLATTEVMPDSDDVVAPPFVAMVIPLDMDGVLAIAMGAGLDMAGVDIIAMLALAEPMDSKCRPSSISTEIVAFLTPLRMLGLRPSCS
jgi:hypothetical protein